MIDRVQKLTGIDVRRGSYALQDAIWSTAVQMKGFTPKVVQNAATQVSRASVQPGGPNYEAVLIREIYNERGRQRADGSLVWFSGSPRNRKGLTARFPEHVPTINATMELKRYGAVWRIRFDGGADQTLGSAVPADCQLRAHGRMEGGVIIAGFVPFEDGDYVLSAEDLAADPGGVTIALKGGKAEVGPVGAFRHCPVMTRFGGTYRQVRRPRA